MPVPGISGEPGVVEGCPGRIGLGVGVQVSGNTAAGVETAEAGLGSSFSMRRLSIDMSPSPWWVNPTQVGWSFTTMSVENEVVEVATPMAWDSAMTSLTDFPLTLS